MARMEEETSATVWELAFHGNVSMRSQLLYKVPWEHRTFWKAVLGALHELTPTGFLCLRFLGRDI